MPNMTLLTKIMSNFARPSRAVMPRRQVLLAMAVAALPLLGASEQVRAQDIGTLRIVVAFPPGGSTDALARIIAEKIRGQYASTVIVENKPGSGGRIGTRAVKDSAPDGTTVLFTTDPVFTIYPHAYKSLAYKPLVDFAPVAQVGKAPMAFAVGPKVPAEVKTLAEYTAWAAKSPDNAFVGTSGAGSVAHFLGVMLAQGSKVQYTPIHYAGDAPQITAALGSEVPAIALLVSAILPHAEKGTLRVLATGGETRSPLLPNVPTFREAGFDIQADLSAGFYAPAGTPPALVTKLSEAVREAVNMPETQEALRKYGFAPAASTPQELYADIEARTNRWGPVVKASGFTADE